MEGHVKKEEFNPFTQVHLFYYTYIDTELHLLLHKPCKSIEDNYQEFYEDISESDNAPPFAIARLMATKYRGLLKQNNIEKMSKEEALTETDIHKSSEFIWYQIWEDEVFHEFLDKLSSNPIQYDHIYGKLIYFLEIPQINIKSLNENLEKINYDYSFIYKKYIYESIDGESMSLLNLFDFNSHIQMTIKRTLEDMLDYYVIVSCKPPGSNKDQAGFFHFPALFNGIYRKNLEKWLYIISSTDELPDESILKKCKAVVIPGSHLHVYDDLEFLRKTEAWIRDLIHNWPKIKYLGICFGFQLLSDALGGKTESIGNGVFIKGGETLSLENKLWDFNFIKASGLTPTDSVNIVQSHGDQVIRLPDYQKYKIRNFGSSKTCETELLVSEDERILGFQGHPEYIPSFTIHRVAPLICKWQGLEQSVESYTKIRDEYLSESKNHKIHSLELRNICHTFLKFHLD
jgi:GMP synthase-like glutamine amidotransferase